jgi:hypothetical protein
LEGNGSSAGVSTERVARDVEGPTPGSGSKFAGVTTERVAVELEAGGVGTWMDPGMEMLGSGPAECPGTMIVGTPIGVSVVGVPVISLIGVTGIDGNAVIVSTLTLMMMVVPITDCGGPVGPSFTSALFAFIALFNAPATMATVSTAPRIIKIMIIVHFRWGRFRGATI